MTDVVIDRFLSEARVRGADDEARVRRLVGDLTRDDLQRAFDAATVPHGLWCLRRVDVEVVLGDRSDHDIGRSWAEAVVSSVVTALSGPVGADSLDVVGYAGPQDVVSDLVTSLARGHVQREWAWRSLAVLVPDDPAPSRDAGGAALAALIRRPETIVPALVDAVRAAGAAAVHQLLGGDGWRTLTTAVLRLMGGDPPAWPLERKPPADASATWQRPQTDVAAPTGSRAASPGGPVDATATAVVMRSRLARAWRTSGVRLGASTAHAIAVFAVVETEPALLRHAASARVIAAVTAHLRDGTAPGSGLRIPVSGTGTHPSPLPVTGGGDGELAGTASRPVDADTGVSTRPRSQSPPDVGNGTPQYDDGPAVRGSADLGEPTSLGGLVYLLATAADAGVPDDLLADPALQGLLPSVLLHHMLVRVADVAAPSQPPDPAVCALSGVTRDDAPPPPLSEAADAALEHHADQWRRVTAERLAAVDDAQTAVTALVRRQGTVDAQPGWIEFRLRLDDVDLAVRRAGLDIDPGFVTWLGAVVVIRYA